MPDARAKLPAGLSVHGIPYTCGFTWAGTEKANRRPLDLAGLMELAAGRGLEGVEFPARMLPDASPEGLREVRQRAEELGLTIVLAGGRAQAEHLLEQLELAVALGAPTVRCVLSGILCGDRRGFPGGWAAHLEQCAEELERVLPAAERCRVAVAVENHQDASSEDLLRLCRRFESRYFGVTLDTGNPLAVMEEPLEFAGRLAPYLRNAHLKDYRIHRAENGLRLVRCPLGAGVIDFPALYRLFAEQEWPITRSIELGALQARLIPILERSWWDEYPPRDTRDLLAPLALAWTRALPPEAEWRTPYERDDAPEVLAAYERKELEASLEYLEALGVGP
jgi:sugar phosphate isomerase/epimerase